MTDLCPKYCSGFRSCAANNVPIYRLALTRSGVVLAALEPGITVAPDGGPFG